MLFDFRLWLRRISGRLLPNRHLLRRHKRPRQLLTQIEQLEDRLAPSLSALVSFSGANGNKPMSGLVQDSNGDLFGTTAFGGASSEGTVFEITYNGSAYSSTPTTLASFTGTNGTNPPGTTGTNPIGNVVRDSAGNIFGAAGSGGTNGDGTVWELAAGGNTITVLATFSSSTGENPGAGLIEDSAGDLFGTTQFGGTGGNGTVYEVKAGSGVVTTLTSFNGTNGQDPLGGLVMDGNGNLFGTTADGGANGEGAIFELPYNSGSQTYGTIISLASFAAVNGSSENATGAGSRASLVMDSSGDLFGTAGSGGPTSAGTVFELPFSNGSYGAITAATATFNGTNGSHPTTPLIRDANGNLFGTTSAGGANGLGAIFEVPAGTGTVFTLASLTAATTGSTPAAGLLENSSGDLFGTADQAGPSSDGTVFEYAPSIVTVTSLVDGAGTFTPGSNPTDTTLRGALANAPTGSTIVFQNGLSGTLTLTSALSISDNLTISGPGAATIAISGNNASSVFSATSSATVILSGLTIENGHATNGGGIANNGGILALTNDTFSGNAATSDGAGVYSTGTATIVGCTFLTNAAQVSGGGIDNAIGGTMTLTNDTISGNTAQSDGAGVFNNGTITIAGSAMLNNSAGAGGGGLFTDTTTSAIVNDSTFDGNQGLGSGGAIYNGAGGLTITNSTITGNFGGASAGNGGGLELPAGTTLLFNTLVVGNTIVGGSTASDIGGGSANASSTNNLIGTGGSGGLTNGGANANQVGVSIPKLGTLGYYGGPTETIPLLAGSPALATGSVAAANNAGLTTDQRAGLPRTVSSLVDIGRCGNAGQSVSSQHRSRRPGRQPRRGDAAAGDRAGRRTHPRIARRHHL